MWQLRRVLRIPNIILSHSVIAAMCRWITYIFVLLLGTSITFIEPVSVHDYIVVPCNFHFVNYYGILLSLPEDWMVFLFRRCSAAGNDFGQYHVGWKPANQPK